MHTSDSATLSFVFRVNDRVFFHQNLPLYRRTKTSLIWCTDGTDGKTRSRNRRRCTASLWRTGGETFPGSHTLGCFLYTSGVFVAPSFTVHWKAEKCDCQRPHISIQSTWRLGRRPILRLRDRTPGSGSSRTSDICIGFECIRHYADQWEASGADYIEGSTRNTRFAARES